MTVEIEVGYVSLQVELRNLAGGEKPLEVAAYVKRSVEMEYPDLTAEVTVLGYGATLTEKTEPVD